MKSWVKDTNLWLVAGAGLYWASYAFRIMGGTPGYVAAVGANAAVIEDVFMTLWVVASYLACRAWDVRRWRLRTSAAVVCASLAVLACEALSPALGLLGSLVVMCLDFFTLGASMMLWGLAFASLDKRLAAHNVVMAVLAAAALILLGQVLSAVISFPWLTNLCTAAAAAAMAGDRITLRVRQRRPQMPSCRTLAVLGTQRLVYGFSLGFFPTVVTTLPLAAANKVLLVFSLVIIAGSTLAILFSEVPGYTILPGLVLVAGNVLFIPFMHIGMAAALPSFISGVWLAWQTLSSVQLSDLKGKLGMSALDISFADKLAIAVTILAGAAGARGVELLAGTAAMHSNQVATLLFMAFCALMLVSAFALAQLVGVHQESAFRSQVEQENAEREARAVATVAASYGLSARERQVFGMLAQGHTSAFVAEVIGVTNNTAKAHVAHIYQKLGVHSKDEMLGLLEETAASEG